MNLLSIFARKAPNRVFLSILLGAFAGISYSFLIPLVVGALQPADPMFPGADNGAVKVFGVEISNHKIAAFYVVTCLLILLSRSFSEIVLTRVANEVSKDFRVGFYQKIRNAPIAALENIGTARIIASLNIDVPRMVNGSRVIPGLVVSLVSVLGMLLFLLFLQPEVFKLVVGAIFAGALIYQIPMMLGRRIFLRSRQVMDDLQGGIRGLLMGAKELKLSRTKQDAYINRVLMPNEQEILRNDNLAHTIMQGTHNFGDLISFLVIGLVSFVFVNYYTLTSEELVGIVLALLYLVAPISNMLNSVPPVTIAFVSYRKIMQVQSKIPNEGVVDKVEPVKPWSVIRLFDVEYEYKSFGDSSFKVGPINCEIQRGEITFIVGGNGSGKSTLGKILTLHYQCDSGYLMFGDVVVTDKNKNSYREEIAAIFSDFHLFESLLGHIDDRLLHDANRYLNDLGLSDKVSITEGIFSTLNLSDGQRRRLALLVSFLDDKSVYVFDEWAADQDPEFKSVFYRKILPELKRKGKSVVVISHDDRYFDAADRILVMEQGNISSRKSVQGNADTSIRLESGIL